MNIDAIIKSEVYAKKLRAELTKIGAQREEDLKKYDRLVREWKEKLLKWIVENTDERVKRISKAEIQDKGGHNRYSTTRDPRFDHSKFFAGSPIPPKDPSGQRILEIQRTLRHLAITGQANIRVTREMTDKLFGTDYDEE